MSGRRDLGDFQTPPELARGVLATLGPLGAQWTRVLEPTCGAGSFLRAALECNSPPADVIGIDVNADHCAAARSIEVTAAGTSLRVVHASLFAIDLRRELSWRVRGPLLVVGNPPWVTTAELGRLESTNQPVRRNLKGAPGLAARTGASNFDLGEAVWIKLIEELADEAPTIALLCKSSVARSVIHYVHRRGLSVAAASLHEIDAHRWFGASVRACLFRLTLGESHAPIQVPVYAGLDHQPPRQVMEFRDDTLIADAKALAPFAFAMGTSPLTWRQGLKHDAASVMELIRDQPGGPLRNQLGEVVDVEHEHIFPLIKGSDVGKPPAERPRRRVIVTQRSLSDPISDLSTSAPRLWSYLQRHATRFGARKSSIYRGRPPFSVFGIGPYSFTPWKVVVSGLHHPARFQAVGPVEGRPVMADDTCYLLPCDSPTEAAVLTALCGDRLSLGLIAALSFPGAKRPVTKGLLQRLDLSAILRRVDRAELAGRARSVLAGFQDPAADDQGAISIAVEMLERRFARIDAAPSHPC